MAAALLNSNRQTTTKFTAICHAKLHTDRTQHRQATHTVAYSDAGTAAGTQGVRAAAGAQEMHHSRTRKVERRNPHAES